MKNEELIFTDSENKEKAILGTLEGPCADFVSSTRNGRHYSEKLWQKVFNDPIVTEMIENGGVPGELDHPTDREEIDSSRIAIMLREKPVKKNGKLWAKFDILNTPLGKIAYTLAKAGFKLGISSRGSGDTYSNYDGTEEVDEKSYDFKCFDLVLLPAVKDARLKLVTEGLSNNSFNYKKALKESLDNSKEEERKLMEDTLSNLGIEIEENNPLNENKETIKNAMNELRDYLDNWQKEHLSKEYVIDVREAGWDDDTDNAFLMLINQLTDIRNENLNINEEIDDKGVERYGVNGEWWYFTTHGVQPGSIPKGIVVLKVLEGENSKGMKGTYFCSDRVLNTSELKEYDIVEDSPNVNKDESLNINEEVNTTAVDNNEAIVNELQETIKQKQELEQQLIELQEKLSVCYTKENKYEEQLENNKKMLKSLSFANTRVNALKEKLSKAEKDLESSKLNESNLNIRVQKLEKTILSNKEIKNSLNENISNKEEKINSLNEKLNTVNKEKEQLNEQLEDLRKDLEIKKSEYSKKITNANSLVEKYQKIANRAVDKYINSQSTRLGIKPEEIKNRLPESYTFNDIDDVCDNLREYKVNIGRLPFNTLNENIRMKAKGSQNEHLAINDGSDDTVDAQLLNLANIRL